MKVTRTRRAARRATLRASVAAKQQSEHYARVGTFTSAGDRQVMVTHKEPLLDEAFAIQRQRNAQASEKPPDTSTRLEQIEQELAVRHRIQRLNALEIGALYYEAKRLLPHGQFLPWVKKTGLYRQSAVVNYMRVYKYCVGRPELVESIKPTCLQIVCAANFPQDLREGIFRRGGYSGTVEQLKDVARGVRSGTLKMKSKQVQALLRDLEYDGLDNVMKELLSHLRAQVSRTRQELQKLVPVKQNGASLVGLVPVITQRIRECEAFEQTLA